MSSFLHCSPCHSKMTPQNNFSLVTVNVTFEITCHFFKGPTVFEKLIQVILTPLSEVAQMQFHIRTMHTDHVMSWLSV